MSTELLEPETALSLIPHDAQIARAPKEVLEGAVLAATALKDVIARKKNPVVFRGEQYLQYEDWQTIGGFFGSSVATGDAELIDIDGVRGFRAKARVIDGNGIEVSTAEAYCMKDEDNWKNKPLFQLASMAQTRAGAKALRNKFAWVAVLAGYSPTPAEEMAEVHHDTPTVADDVPSCPLCDSSMWDNRTTKKGKQPDFKCKNRDCNKAIWLNDEAKAAPASNGFSDDQVLRDQLFAQAEHLLVNTPEAKRKDALGRLMMLSTAQMAEKINEMAENARAKSGEIPRETERDANIREIRASALPQTIDEYLKQDFEGRTLDSLSDDEIKAVREELVLPF